MSEYGMPYMGSKSKIAASIALNFPKATHFYDLFGGGGAITHYMALHKQRNYKHFHYNEIKSDVTNLFCEAISGKYSYKTFKPPWVSREDFFKNKDTDAYVRCLWSFGNNQKTYLFSKDIEPYKRSMHMAIVFDTFDNLSSQVLRLDKWPHNIDSITKKRLYLKHLIEHYRKTNTLPKILHQYLDSKRLQQLRRLQELQQLEQLERLQRLQQLQQLPMLSMTSLSYEQVPIESDSVVYCDIPYKDTENYINTFDNKAFHDWAACQPFPVFISEYEIKDARFECVYTVEKRSLLSADKCVGNKLEKLYWNKVTL